MCKTRGYVPTTRWRDSVKFRTGGDPVKSAGKPATRSRPSRTGGPGENPGPTVTVRMGDSARGFWRRWTLGDRQQGLPARVLRLSSVSPCPRCTGVEHGGQRDRDRGDAPRHRAGAARPRRYQPESQRRRVILDAAGEIAGAGHTAPAGGPHAEIVARSRRPATGPAAAPRWSRSSPATTPAAPAPARDALLAAGISRVVVAVRDPNPLAAGGADTPARRRGRGRLRGTGRRARPRA